MQHKLYLKSACQHFMCMKHMQLNSSGNIKTLKWDQPRITNISEEADIHIKKKKTKTKGEKEGRENLKLYKLILLINLNLL